MKINIDVGKDFYHRLANRDKYQGDGKHTAVEFRGKYLAECDSEEYWKNPTDEIVFDFKNVKKIGPSFANEAFAYFTKYASAKKILSVIKFVNITNVQQGIIYEELESVQGGL